MYNKQTHMRIGIDCRLAGKQHAGLGRYIENLVQQLLVGEYKVSWFLYFHDKQQAESVLAGDFIPSNCTVRFAPIKHYSLAEQLVLPFIFYKDSLTLLHVPHFNAPLLYLLSTVVTIHDLLWHEKKGAGVTTLNPLLYWIKYVFYRLIATTNIVRAKHIFVPAETVKNTISKYYPKVTHKITVTTEGTTLQKFKNKKILKTPHSLLYVGSLYPHKNIQIVLDALKKMPNYNLTIVGSRNVFQDKVIRYVEERQLQQKVTFLGYVTDEKLAQLYQKAAVLVQPSLSEGFGLTGVEAFSLGTPVAASDIPIFHEIYGNAACYFDPHNVPSFIQSVQKAEKQSSSAFQKKAEAIVAQYSWHDMAKQTAQQYLTTCSHA